MDKAKHEGIKSAQSKLGKNGVQEGFDPETSSDRYRERRSSDRAENLSKSDRELSAPSVSSFRRHSSKTPSFLRKSNSAPKRHQLLPKFTYGALSQATAVQERQRILDTTGNQNMDLWDKQRTDRWQFQETASCRERRGDTLKNVGDEWDSGYHGDGVHIGECFTPITGMSTWGSAGSYSLLRRSWSDNYSCQIDWNTQLQASKPATFRVRCIYSYRAQMPCDLTFKKGDMIEVLTRTDRWDDWWEGRINGRIGIFPANFTDLASS